MKANHSSVPRYELQEKNVWAGRGIDGYVIRIRPSTAGCASPWSTRAQSAASRLYERGEATNSASVSCDRDGGYAAAFHQRACADHHDRCLEQS
ncbi:MAG TPA: hypothetical protein VN181_14725, partial [Thermoanaerobaculia bacterium]|nr:hypothetical protein [Thermoanaerobaculia bacterium]